MYLTFDDSTSGLDYTFDGITFDGDRWSFIHLTIFVLSFMSWSSIVPSLSLRFIMYSMLSYEGDLHSKVNSLDDDNIRSCIWSDIIRCFIMSMILLHVDASMMISIYIGDFASDRAMMILHVDDLALFNDHTSFDSIILHLIFDLMTFHSIWWSVIQFDDFN